MKLLSVALARSLWLGHVRDLNPRGFYLYPSLLQFLTDIYKFKKYPSPNDVRNESEDIIFESGEYKNSNGEMINIKLTVSNYGIMAESGSSTKDTDDFLNEMLSGIKDIFNLPDYNDILKNKQYLSQLYFNTDKSLEVINPKLKEISNYLNKAVVGYSKVKYELGGISFWPDQSDGVNPYIFSLERAVSVPFSENRYLSSCGLQTDEHIELLEKIEEILS